MFSLAVCLLMVAAVSMTGFAQESTASSGQAGGNLLTTLQTVLTGNIGLFIGLFVVVLGLWTWVINQETGAGITMIIGGVLITLAPGIFNGVRDFSANIVGGFGGNAFQVDTTNIQ